MRVLLIAHGFPPAAMGGTEIYTHDLGLALIQGFGDEVFVLTREADPERDEYAVREIDQNGMHVFVINNTFGSCTSFADTYRNPAIRAVGARIIDQVQPDVAHLQHITCLSTELLEELNLRHIPTFFTLNDYWLICHRGQLFDMDLERCPGPEAGCDRCIRGDAGAGPAAYRIARTVRRLEHSLPGAMGRGFGSCARAAGRLFSSRTRAEAEGRRRARHMRRVACLCDQIIAPSRTLHRRFLDFGIPPKKISYVPQGINLKRFEGLERSTGDRLRIGFFGSMIVSKAPHLLLGAFSRLPAGSASLEIYGGFGSYHGDDSYRHVVEPLLDQPGVNHHGTIPHAEVPAAMADVDVMVIPSTWLENAPFVIREAFTAGIPVVASDIGGMAEMVGHEVNGLHFSAGSADALARALRRLIDEPDLLGRLRAGIPEMMATEADAAQLRQLYQVSIAAREPPAKFTESSKREVADHAREGINPSPTENCRRGGVDPRPLRPTIAGGSRGKAGSSHLAAVVLNYRTAGDTVLAVRSLQSSLRPPETIIVVDNGSDDGSEQQLRQGLDGVQIVQTGRNLGFSGGCNAGIRAALGGGADRVFLMNSDVMVAADTLLRLERTLDADENLGQAAPLILHRSDPSRIASAGMRFARATGRMRHVGAEQPLDPVALPATREVAAVSGCAALVDRRVFDRIGLLDEDYFFTFEDLDLGLRAKRAGLATVCVGDAVAYHAGALSIGPTSPLRLYYATRNHLLAAKRAAPLPWPLSLARAKLIVLLNLAHAVLFPGVSTTRALREVARGTWHHLRGRYGQAD